MVVSYIETNITWLNVFPKKNGIFKTLKASTIMLVETKIYDTHATLKPGSYVYFKVKAIRTNDTKTSSVAAIPLKKSNERGGHYSVY